MADDDRIPAELRERARARAASGGGATTAKRPGKNTGRKHAARGGRLMVGYLSACSGLVMVGAMTTAARSSATAPATPPPIQTRRVIVVPAANAAPVTSPAVAPTTSLATDAVGAARVSPTTTSIPLTVLTVPPTTTTIPPTTTKSSGS